MKTSAMSISAIFSIEAPQNDWADLLPELYQHSLNSDPNQRYAAILTFGYICEDVHPSNLKSEDLGSIIPGVLNNIDESNVELTKIAIKAFARAAPITKPYMESPEHRNFIMTNLFKAQSIADKEILLSLMEALCDIAKVAYDFIGDYIQQIGSLTTYFINTDFEEVAIMGIEFWISLCEAEIERNTQGKQHANIITTYSNAILQILQAGLNKKNEAEVDELQDSTEESDWSVCLACIQCLEHMSQILKDAIIPDMTNYAFPKLSSQDWYDRYVAILTIGAIMEGPSQDYMIQGFQQTTS